MKKTALFLFLLASLMSGCVIYDDPHREGLPRHGERDRDRDGIPDRVDRDRDGDGVGNRHDRRPGDRTRD